jgi:hypothetical protein
VIVPDFGTIQGPFQITSLEYRGDHAAEVTFEIALESAGAVSFVAMRGGEWRVANGEVPDRAVLELG